jgi:hypothetical protein
MISSYFAPILRPLPCILPRYRRRQAALDRSAFRRCSSTYLIGWRGPCYQKNKIGALETLKASKDPGQRFDAFPEARQGKPPVWRPSRAPAAWRWCTLPFGAHPADGSPTANTECGSPLSDNEGLRRPRHDRGPELAPTARSSRKPDHRTAAVELESGAPRDRGVMPGLSPPAVLAGCIYRPTGCR